MPPQGVPAPSLLPSAPPLSEPSKIPSGSATRADRVFIGYDEAGEPWHEHYLLAEVGAGDWVVVTPDNDVYIETILSPPLGGVRAAPPDGALPFGFGAVHGNPIYRFSVNPSPAQLEVLVQEVERMAALARRGEPSRYGPELPVLHPRPGDPLRPDLLFPHGDHLRPPGADDTGAHPSALRNEPAPDAFKGMQWHCVDPDGPLAIGTVLTYSDLNGSIVMKGNMALMGFNAVDVVTLRLVVGSAAETMELFRRAWASLTPRSPRSADDAGPAPARAGAPAKRAVAAHDDARTLAVERNSAGERFRPFSSVAENSSQIDFSDWPLDGPRTAAWLTREIGRTGMGPAARQEQWKHENRLQDDDHHCQVHELLSELLELFGCVDQLDMTNLAGLESLSRHFQFLEFEVKKKMDAKKPSHDNSEYYLGRPRRTGGALVSPELMKWVAEKASKDSAVLKEQRKAAEERALARNPKK